MEPITIKVPQSENNCQLNPFCSTEISFWFEVQTGYEVIFGKDTYEELNPSARLFFYNKGREAFPDIHGLAFGLSPLLQGHTGNSRHAFSTGATLRLVGMESKSTPPFWGALGLDLSLHGGEGKLDLHQNHQYWKGNYSFFGIDLALHGRLYLLTGYIGGGIRFEGWPTPQGSQKISEKKIFPALLIGGGIP